jgi:hypothetical protein
MAAVQIREIHTKKGFCHGADFALTGPCELRGAPERSAAHLASTPSMSKRQVILSIQMRGQEVPTIKPRDQQGGLS